MQSSYIIDAFLTGTAWMMIAYLYFGSSAMIKELDGLMSAGTLEVAIAESFKLGAMLALPFGVLFVFLLWRFYGLMIATQTWGAGGLGLLIALLLIGLTLIALYAILICVRRSRFITLSKQINHEREPAR